MNTTNEATTPSTPVQTTQQLLALQSARIQKQNREHELDNDPVIKALKEELSLYGDSVAASVDRNDPYYDAPADDPAMFQAAVQKVREQAGEIPESLEKIFGQLLH